MQRLTRFGFILALLASGLTAPAGAAQAQSIGPEGTPQVDASTERLDYSDAATPHLLTQYEWVFSELDKFPDDPTPEQTKKSDLRKRLLDLRLLMDLYAFAFDQNDFNDYRDVVDNAYERVGEFKDLFDAQDINKLPINLGFQEERRIAMDASLVQLRDPGYRDGLRNFFHQQFGRPHHLDEFEKPRIWQAAMAEPNTRIDAAGNAAMLGNFTVRNLAEQGMLIDDIMEPSQEAHMHDVRKALRSVETIVDMFPSLTAAVGDAREPLDGLVSDFGKVNDQIVALRLEEAQGFDVSDRQDAVRKAYAKVRKSVGEWIESPDLDNYGYRLEIAQRQHRMK